MRPRWVEGSAFVVALAVMVWSLMAIATHKTDETTQTAALTSAVPTEEPASSPADASTPAPVHSAAAGKPATTRAPTTGVTNGGAVRPGAAKPPIAGKYHYDEASSTGTRDSTLEITDQGAGKQIENMDDGSQVDEVIWKPSGKFTNATTFQGGPGGSVRCDWNPDVADYMFPLHAGLSWTLKSSCHPNATTEVDVNGTARVTSTKRLTIAGEQVDT